MQFVQETNCDSIRSRRKLCIPEPNKCFLLRLLPWEFWVDSVSIGVCRKPQLVHVPLLINIVVIQSVEPAHRFQNSNFNLHNFWVKLIKQFIKNYFIWNRHNVIGIHNICGNN